MQRAAGHVEMSMIAPIGVKDSRGSALSSCSGKLRYVSLSQVHRGEYALPAGSTGADDRFETLFNECARTVIIGFVIVPPVTTTISLD